MPLRAVRFEGLNRDVFIPDDIEVLIDIVPSSRTNIRSNQVFTGQNKTTWHDTGNPNSNALGERNWLHSGAGGAYVGYNFAFDGQRIVQLTPLNEITWAAGTPEGNKFSWHAEQCLNTNWDRALYVGAALHGGLCAAMGWNVDTALVQHNYWYGKHCPAQIRNKGLWPTVVQMVKDAAAKATAAGGGTSPDQPDYATPVPPVVNGKVWDGLKDVTIDNVLYHADAKTVTVSASSLNRRRGPRVAEPLVGAALPQSTTFAVLGWVEGDDVDGNNRWWVTMWGSYMWSGGTVEQPVERPSFDPNTVRVVENDNVYYPAGVGGKGREVVLVEDADLYQYATFGSKKIGRKSANEKAVAVWWTTGDSDDMEDLWWILDAEGEDDLHNGPRLHVTSTFQRPF